MLCFNQALRSVDLSFNSVPPTFAADVADDCVIPLCRALAVNTALVSLRYAHALLTTSAGVQLGHALAFNRALLELDLSFNAIGDAGCSTVASALAVNCCLERLSLASNHIGKIGAGALCQALHAATPNAAAAAGARSTQNASPGRSSALALPMSPFAPRGGGFESDSSDGGGGIGSRLGSGAPASSQLCELNLEWNDLDKSTQAALRDAWAVNPSRPPEGLTL
jgi:hypothetical protein